MVVGSTVTNPQCAMQIWNYTHRLSHPQTSSSDINTIDQILVPTTSVTSMMTQKSKGRANGTFKVTLAPTFNWVSRITPGSWCVMLMSRDAQIELANSGGKVDERTFRMLGRIESVRAVHQVNQDTGARSLQYVVTGSDWGSVFNSVLYIDVVNRNNNLDQYGAIGQSYRLLFTNDDLEKAANAGGPSTTQVVEGILNLWGSPLQEAGAGLKNVNGDYTSQKQFTLPVQVANYMRLNSITDITSSNSFADLIDVQSGPLKKYDTYDTGHIDAQGIPAPASFYGKHTLWSLMVMNSNPILNEMLTDIRFEGDDPSKSKPTLTLYKRIRPFSYSSQIIGENTPGPVVLASTVENEPGVGENLSLFENIRRVYIPLKDIITINVGLNWRDKLNFIEIQPDPTDSAFAKYSENSTKAEQQISDITAYQREGFKPLFQKANYVAYPIDTQKKAFITTTNWKYLLKDWHFNTHLLGNGTVNFIGIDKYIQVGDNIIMDARVLGVPQNYNSPQYLARAEADINKPNDKFFTAHVETVSHSMEVDASGARKFITSIQFVRGVITNAAGQIQSYVSGSDYLLQQDATIMDSRQERNSASNVISQTSKTDPDKDQGFLKNK